MLAVYLCAHSVGCSRRGKEAPSVARMLPVSVHHMAGIITIFISILPANCETTCPPTNKLSRALTDHLSYHLCMVHASKQ